MRTELAWDLLKPYVEDPSYGLNDMDFYVRDLDYVLYLEQCKNNMINPIKPVDNCIRNHRYYFFVKYEDIRGELIMSIKIASDKQAFKTIVGPRSDGRYQALKINYENLIKEHVDLEEKFHTVFVDNYHLAEYVQELEKQHEDSVCYERELVKEWNEQQRIMEELAGKISKLEATIYGLCDIIACSEIESDIEEYPDFGDNPYQE